MTRKVLTVEQDANGVGSKEAVASSSALTAQLTTITPADAAGTPDYAITAVTSTTPFGFANAAELITVLYVIQNLQTRLAEVETALEAIGAVTTN